MIVLVPDDSIRHQDGLPLLLLHRISAEVLLLVLQAVAVQELLLCTVGTVVASVVTVVAECYHCPLPPGFLSVHSAESMAVMVEAGSFH